MLKKITDFTKGETFHRISNSYETVDTNQNEDERAEIKAEHLEKFEDFASNVTPDPLNGITPDCFTTDTKYCYEEIGDG
ncbi:hypothetical protein M0804_001831 [Polistes exclamans]|nr:hypothetical protein M0804_001831 [Polistes exclamans]